MELTFPPILKVTPWTLCYFGKELNTVDFIYQTWHFEVCTVIIKLNLWVQFNHHATISIHFSIWYDLLPFLKVA